MRAARLVALTLSLVACTPSKPSRDASVARDVPVVRDVVVARDVAVVRDVPRGPVAPFTLGFAGDVTLNEGLATRRPFRDVAPWMRAVASAWVNLETSVAERGTGQLADKPFLFRSPPESVAVLREAGIDGVSLANNHAFDLGAEGLSRTMELLDAGGVLYTGAGRDHDGAYRAVRLNLAGRSVAMLGFYRMNCEYTWEPRSGRAGLASAWRDHEDESVEAVRRAKAESDVVAVMVHWGNEREPCPEKWQRELARRWVRAGASLVVGSHAHVLQGAERFGDAWVLYSTGNFAFPMARAESALTAFFEATVGDGAIALRARPATIVDGVPSPASSYDARVILRTLTRRSHGVRFDAEGVASSASGLSECPWPALRE